MGKAAPSSDADWLTISPMTSYTPPAYADPISAAELTEYLAQFTGYFKRSEGRQSLERSFDWTPDSYR
jgi:hypothetical protein